MNPIRVLVVDDEPMMLEITQELLQSVPGFEVRTATRGERALEMTSEAPPDVVLLDVMMPGLDGLEVCRKIKGDPSLASVKVVLNSSLRENHVDWRACGADGYREKSRDLRELPGLLRSLVAPDGRAGVEG